MMIIDWQLVASDLERKVASLTKERDELKAGYSSELSVVCKKDIAAQAREQKLRDEIRRLTRDHPSSSTLPSTQDDTALQARLKEEHKAGYAAAIEAVKAGMPRYFYHPVTGAEIGPCYKLPEDV